MGINSFEEAVAVATDHGGHTIGFAIYGNADLTVGVTLECETCYVVLMSWDAEEPKANDPFASVKPEDLIFNEKMMEPFKAIFEGAVANAKENPDLMNRRFLFAGTSGYPPTLHAYKAPQSREAWNAYNNLHDAARLIESTCAWAEKDEAVYDRLADFVWNTIDAPLEEVASELRRAAQFIVGTERESKVDINEILSVVPEPWEAEEHPCGYAAWHAERENCYHKDCYEQRKAIEQALACYEALDVIDNAMDDYTLVIDMQQDIKERLLESFAHEDDEDETHGEERVLLVAFDIMPTVSVEEAHKVLMNALVTHLNPVMNDLGIDSWWVAEDSRIDGSDCDSAVFVPYGDQASFTMKGMREACVNWRESGYTVGREQGEKEGFDRGYNALVESLEEWLGWWEKFRANDLGSMSEEEIARVASVYDNGGSFEEFLIRELFFINEGK